MIVTCLSPLQTKSSELVRFQKPGVLFGSAQDFKTPPEKVDDKWVGVDGNCMLYCLYGYELYKKYLNNVEDCGYGLADIKTAAEMASNDTSKVKLSAPVLTRGLGYTVTWNKVANADYYYVYDSNDNDAYTVVMAEDDKATYSYEVEVVGNHNVYVVAHSYFTAYNSSPASNVMATPEVKPVFSYKSMSDGLYKFDETHFKLVGQNASYTIGDEIRVKVVDVDFYRRRTEFRLLEKENKREDNSK